MPVLCHTTELTTRAEELARQLEVRVLELEDLERGNSRSKSPNPPQTSTSGISSTVSEKPRRLPWLLRREPGKHFSYVPGFEPVGKDCEYEPIDDDDIEDDTHPAAGH